MARIPTLTSYAAVAAFVAAQDRPVYVRYSRGPVADRRMGASRNHATGRREAGLSVEGPLQAPEWYLANTDPERARDEYLVMQLTSYVFIALGGGSRIRCWLLTGRECGRGGDNEPLLTDWQPLAYVAPEALEEARALQRAYGLI